MRNVAKSLDKEVMLIADRCSRVPAAMAVGETTVLGLVLSYHTPGG